MMPTTILSIAEVLGLSSAEACTPASKVAAPAAEAARNRRRGRPVSGELRRQEHSYFEKLVVRRSGNIQNTELLQDWDDTCKFESASQREIVSCPKRCVFCGLNCSHSSTHFRRSN